VSAAKTSVIAAVVLVVTFVAGVAVGFGAGRFAHMFGRGRGPHFAQSMLVNRLDRQLDLTDAQETRIRAILDQRHARMRQEIAGTNGEIERVLTPEQREKFRKLRLHMPGPSGSGAQRP
jgi:Spy/CpxP family protein refolding chaperone